MSSSYSKESDENKRGFSDGYSQGHEDGKWFGFWWGVGVTAFVVCPLLHQFWEWVY